MLSRLSREGSSVRSPLRGKTVKLMNVATATMTKREVLRIIGDGTNRYGIFDANNVPMSRDIPPFA